MRAAGSSPSPWIWPAIASSGPPRSAAAKSRSSSRGDDTALSALGRSQETLGPCRLVEEHGELGEIRIPLDQGRYRSEPCERSAIEIPYRLRDRRAVIVDQDRPAVGVVRRVAGQMNLADRSAGHRVQIRERILVEVAAAHVDVVDVQQDAAPGPAAKLAEELGLGDRRVAEPEVARRVLDQDRPAESLLNLLDPAARRL